MKLTFKINLENMIEQVNQKIHTITKVKRYLNYKQIKLIMSSFINILV